MGYRVCMVPINYNFTVSIHALESPKPSFGGEKFKRRVGGGILRCVRYP